MARTEKPGLIDRTLSQLRDAWRDADIEQYKKHSANCDTVLTCGRGCKSASYTARYRPPKDNLVLDRPIDTLGIH